MNRMSWVLLALVPLLLIRSDHMVLEDLSSAVRATSGPDWSACQASGAPGSSTYASAEPAGFRSITALSFHGPSRSDPPSDRDRSRRIAGRTVPAVDVPAAHGWEVSEIDSQFRVVADSSAPASPPFVGEARYPVGFGDGRTPAWAERDVSHHAYSRIYLCLWVKLSSNWRGHQSGVNKIGFVWTSGKPVVAIAAFGSGDGPLIPQIRLQDLPSSVRSARNLEPNQGETKIRRGAWHRWEVLLDMNDWTEANGEVHWWIDGEKVGEYRDVRFVAPPADGTWERVAWRPIWGGRGDAVRQTMYMWLDHLYVSGVP